MCRFIRSSTTTGRFTRRETAENCKNSKKNFRVDDSRNVACCIAILSSAQVHRCATVCIRIYRTRPRAKEEVVSPRHPDRYVSLSYVILHWRTFAKAVDAGFRILNTPPVFPGKSTSVSLRRLHIYLSYYFTRLYLSGSTTVLEKVRDCRGFRYIDSFSSFSPFHKDFQGNLIDENSYEHTLRETLPFLFSYFSIL